MPSASSRRGEGSRIVAPCKTRCRASRAARPRTILSAASARRRSGDNGCCLVDELFDASCFVATAAYGDNPVAEPVRTLRRYRDRRLASSLPGRALHPRAYYRYGPYGAAALRRYPSLKPARVRFALRPIVAYAPQAHSLSSLRLAFDRAPEEGLDRQPRGVVGERARGGASRRRRARRARDAEVDAAEPPRLLCAPAPCPGAVIARVDPEAPALDRPDRELVGRPRRPGLGRAAPCRGRGRRGRRARGRCGVRTTHGRQASGSAAGRRARRVVLGFSLFLAVSHPVNDAARSPD